MRRLSRRLRLVDNQDGLGLVEILVASLLGLLLMAAVGAAFMNTARITSFTIQNRSSTQTAADAMQEIIEVVHLATPIAVQGRCQHARPRVRRTDRPPDLLARRRDRRGEPGSVTRHLRHPEPATSSTRAAAPPRATASGSSAPAPRTRSGPLPAPSCPRPAPRTTSSPTSTQTATCSRSPAAGRRAAATRLRAFPRHRCRSSGSIIASVNLLAPGATNGPAYLQSKTGMPNVGVQTEIN